MAAQTPDGAPIDLAENRKRMLRGDLYYAFTPDLAQDRKECVRAVRKLNTAVEPTRRELVEIWREYVSNLPLFLFYFYICGFFVIHLVMKSDFIIVHLMIQDFVSLFTIVVAYRITRDETPLPPKAATEEEDEALLDDYPIVEPGLRADYGYNIRCVNLPCTRTYFKPSKLIL